MTYVKLLKFKDRSGKKHSYAATYVDGIMLAQDWQNIQSIINASVS
jgi:hypothetical protein